MNKNIFKKLLLVTLLCICGIAYAASDNYSLQKEVDSPARSALVITPHDSNELATVSRAIYVGGTGDIAVILLDDSSAVTLVGVPAGTVLPVRAKIVKSTGTTATNLVNLF